MTGEGTPAAASADGAGRPPDLTAISPEDFASLVANSSDEQLAEGMKGPNREPALREIFARMAEHLDPQRAKGRDAVIHFKILDRPDGAYDHFELIIRDGKAVVSDNPSEEPRVTIQVGPVDFLKLITNQASGPGLFMTGKLKLEGDLMFAPQITSLFRIPTAAKQEGSS